MHEDLLDALGGQYWTEARELVVATDDQGRLRLSGDLIVPHLEGVERLSYLVSDVATLCQETDDPALAWARLHAEMLPCPSEEDHFPFRIWTDPLSPIPFRKLADLILEALSLEDESESEDELGENGHFIPLDDL